MNDCKISSSSVTWAFAFKWFTRVDSQPMAFIGFSTMRSMVLTVERGRN